MHKSIKFQSTLLNTATDEYICPHKQIRQSLCTLLVLASFAEDKCPLTLTGEACDCLVEKRLQNISENNLLEKQYFTYVTPREKKGNTVQSSADVLLWRAATAATRSRLLAQGENPAFVRGSASQLLLNKELCILASPEIWAQPSS